MVCFLRRSEQSCLPHRTGDAPGAGQSRIGRPWEGGVWSTESHMTWID